MFLSVGPKWGDSRSQELFPCLRNVRLQNGLKWSESPFLRCILTFSRKGVLLRTYASFRKQHGISDGCARVIACSCSLGVIDFFEEVFFCYLSLREFPTLAPPSFAYGGFPCALTAQQSPQYWTRNASSYLKTSVVGGISVSYSYPS